MMRKWNSKLLVGVVAALPMFCFLACGGGGSAPTSPGASIGDFAVKQSFPETNGAAALNQSILVEFTGEVDLSTVDLNSWSFESFDSSSGKTVGETVIGTFRFLENVDSTLDRKTVEFQPAFPSNSTFSNGGFRAGRRYEININGGVGSQTPVIRSVTGAPLLDGYSFTFTTPSGTTPEELFYDETVGGPVRESFFPDDTPDPKTSEIKPVGLNFFIAQGFNAGGGDRNPITLKFNQPINPASYSFNANHVYLEYMDPGLSTSGTTRIEAELTLVENVKTHALVTLTPVGVLPSNALISVIVEKELQDLAGESNEGSIAYNRVFGQIKTIEASGFQYDAVVEEFTNSDLIDHDAAFSQPMADVVAGGLKAAFNYSGNFTIYDYEPLQKEIILNTDFCQVVPKQGVPFTVTGGVFNFRDVVIGEGVRVIGQGSNPLVFLVSGKVDVKGEITVNGGAGARVDTLNSANFSTPGGAGHCGGGAGGQASPQTQVCSAKGDDGRGAFTKISYTGGRGGHTGSAKGGGGGGGSLSTKGDPKYSTYTGIVTGKGGNGSGTDAITKTSPAQGGLAGTTVWQDIDPDNNFFGRTTKMQGGKEVGVQGELKAVTAGSGGGGGGDRVPGTFPSGFPANQKGGGGGGGGGAIVIRALGPIRVYSTGRVNAVGGDGGGGEPAGGCQYGGGGGGASGGMIILESATSVTVDNRSGTYNFGVSADGGICVTGSYGGGGNIQVKYPPNAGGAANRGGYGGLGLIQLMAPDPVNNVSFTTGQIKPDPVLLPSSFGYLSRVRSKWINTGYSERQTTKPGEPRYRNNSTTPGKFGPEYRFAGIQPSGNQAGFIDFQTSNAIPGKPVGWVNYKQAVSGLKTITSVVPVSSTTSFNVLECAGGLGADNTLRGTRLMVVEGVVANAVIEEYLVVGNTDTQIFLKPEVGKAFNMSLAGSLKRPNSFKVMDKFFSLETNGSAGLPMGPNAEILANVRIGFAACSGFDQNGTPIDRHPANGYAFDLETAGGREAFWKKGAGIKARPFIMFDVMFNISFNENNPNQPRGSLSPDSPLPQLDYLVVPFKF